MATFLNGDRERTKGLYLEKNLDGCASSLTRLYYGPLYHISLFHHLLHVFYCLLLPLHHCVYFFFFDSGEFVHVKAVGEEGKDGAVIGIVWRDEQNMHHDFVRLWKHVKTISFGKKRNRKRKLSALERFWKKERLRVTSSLWRYIIDPIILLAWLRGLTIFKLWKRERENLVF